MVCDSPGNNTEGFNCSKSGGSAPGHREQQLIIYSHIGIFDTVIREGQ